MSFWTDIRDTVTAPFRAMGGLVSDLASGKNVFESLGQYGARTFAAYEGPNALLIDKTPLKVVLKNETVDSLTLGITGRVAQRGEMINNVNLKGDKVSMTDAWKYTKSAGTDAAIIGAAVATGGAASAAGFGTAATVGAGYAGAKGLSGFISTGDPSNLIALAGAAGLPGIGSLPDGFSDAFNTAKDFYNQANAAKDDAEDLYSRFARNAPVTSSGYSSDISGYDDPFSSGSSSGSGALILMAGIGLAAFLLLRRHGNA